MIQLRQTVSTTETCPNIDELTASRYLLSPTRSRYRRQKGKVPKVALMVRRSDFAEVKLSSSLRQSQRCENMVAAHRNGTWGASIFRA